MRSDVVESIRFPAWPIVGPLRADKDEDEDDAEEAKDDEEDDDEEAEVDEADDTEDAVTPTPVGDDWTGDEEEPLAEEKDEDEEEDDGTGSWRGGSDPPWGKDPVDKEKDKDKDDDDEEEEEEDDDVAPLKILGVDETP